MSNFAINYPDVELSKNGCYLNDVVSLTAQRKILNPFQQPEAIFVDGYKGFKSWSDNGLFDPDTNNPISRVNYLKKVLDKGGKVTGFHGYLKFAKTDFENINVPDGIRLGSGKTIQAWSNLVDFVPGISYQNLFIREEVDDPSLPLLEQTTYVILRAGHYRNLESKELKSWLNLLTVEVLDELV